MSSSNESPPPPSYSEATSHAHSGSPQDDARPEGWVEGYVEPPSAAHQEAEYRPPAPVAEKPAQPLETAVPNSRSGNADEAGGQDAAATDEPRSRLSFGGWDLGGRVLGYGSGSDVGGWGVKIGPVLLGLVDVEEEKKLRRAREERGRS